MPRRRLSLTVLSALAVATLTLAPTSATAQYRDPRGDQRGGWQDHGGGYARGGFDGYGGEDRRGAYRDRRGYARGYDRHRCRNRGGNTILGAIAGGLLGNFAAGRGDRTAGTIIGGGAGALAGSAIGRDC